MNRVRRRRRIVASAWLSVLIVVSSPAFGQEDHDVDRASVSLLPAEVDPDGPNGGTWFTFVLTGGESASAEARIVNPREQPVDVALSVRSLDFADRVSVVEDRSVGIAPWGGFEPASVTVPARASTTVGFTVTVPPGTRPGDHIGAVVAEVVDEQPEARVVQRVATRLYVTVPGEAKRAFEVVGVDTELDSFWWPRQMLVTVELVNEGEIRVEPDVTIAGIPADGPDVVLAESSEQYLVDLDVPLIGGLVRLPIEAADTSGVVRRANVSRAVVRWGFLAVGLLVILVGWLVVRWWRRHETRTARLERDMRRLERLLRELMETAADRGTRSAAELRRDVSDEQALHAGLKRARRTGDHEGFARLSLRAHELRGDALTELMEALQYGTSLEDELVAAAETYGVDAVAAHPRASQLPKSARDRLLGGA